MWGSYQPLQVTTDAPLGMTPERQFQVMLGRFLRRVVSARDQYQALRYSSGSGADCSNMRAYACAKFRNRAVEISVTDDE